MRPYLPNATPVHLFTPEGPGHDLHEDGVHTRCGMPATGAVKATFAQVHVWLNHTVCVQCFGMEGNRWP